ncbi:MAG: HlyD family type I secretion periplasmic adaptor subunit [Geminicoccaceae bacterium]|nr:MAG: HlyD family type I secretion periplasmic adaptor subunit [Geminicoccaceae bacterium]
MIGFWSFVRSPLLVAALAGGVFFGGLLAFSFAFPMATGAVADGELVHLSNRLPLGHSEGGRVAAVFVRDGDRVEAGDPLLALEDPELERQLTVLEQRTAEARITIARFDALIAEEDVLQPAFAVPDDLLARHRSLLARERETLTQRLQLLQERIGLKEAEIRGLREVERARASEFGEVQSQVALLEELERRGAAPRLRVLEMRRQRYDIETAVAEVRLQRQRAELEVNDARLQYTNERAEAFRRYERERSDNAAELAEYLTSLAALEARRERLVLRAPTLGRVIDLRFTGPGAVLSPNVEAVTLVPEDETIVIQARLSPMDVDKVRIGQQADITFSGLPGRYATRMFATVQQVDAGRTDSERGSYYRAWLQLSDDALAFATTHGGIVSGAPVEVRINTGERTLGSYLVDPLMGWWFRGLREA